VTSPSFSHLRAVSIDDAIQQGARGGAAFVAGGTDLLQLWKSGVAAPAEVVDISRLPVRDIRFDDGALRIGALARMGDIAAHPDVASHFPLIAEAILASASGQIRNMATIGGNLLQRTRCVYFRGSDVPCNKRQPGSGCGACAGENRQAALFGTSPSCIAAHPSDLAVALAALDARVEIRSASGIRSVAMSELYRLPGDAPERDTSIAPGELITAIRITDASRLSARSTYLKVRDRASFEFAVVSVAAALRIENSVIAEARLAAGSVAPMPWRLGRSEARLIGQKPSDDAFAAAGELAVEGALPLAHNAFKVELLRNSVVRALQTIGGQP
jgi:xanthine dehydrogenase YagS FAD-binding subunit